MQRSKAFFFEKKKQKTFRRLSRAHPADVWQWAKVDAAEPPR
jgi:hypothetical protein